MKKTPSARAKDYSGTIKEILGEPNTCSSCHYETVKGGKDWYCERHQTSLPQVSNRFDISRKNC
jgi:hypothetical protein